MRRESGGIAVKITCCSGTRWSDTPTYRDSVSFRHVCAAGRASFAREPDRADVAGCSATLGAAFLGAIVAYIGAVHQQRKQPERDDKTRREQELRDDRLRLVNGIAEILSGAEDVLSGVKMLREAHSRRTLSRYYLRLVATILRDYPLSEKLADVLDVGRLKLLMGTALEVDRFGLDSQRVVAIHAVTELAPRLNRYFSIVGLLTLSQPEPVADAVRELNPAVVAVARSFGRQALRV